jgi:hypothetical protein
MRAGLNKAAIATAEPCPMTLGPGENAAKWPVHYPTPVTRQIDPMIKPGHHRPAAFRSASFIRLCQPLPSALNASNTSGSKRMVVETLVTSALGLPRETGALANFSVQ